MHNTSSGSDSRADKCTVRVCLRAPSCEHQDLNETLIHFLT